MKNFKDTIGNRSRFLPVCSAAQPGTVTGGTWKWTVIYILHSPVMRGHVTFWQIALRVYHLRVVTVKLLCVNITLKIYGYFNRKFIKQISTCLPVGAHAIYRVRMNYRRISLRITWVGSVARSWNSCRLHTVNVTFRWSYIRYCHLARKV
jgi:hypothetical protein